MTHQQWSISAPVVERLNAMLGGVIQIAAITRGLSRSSVYRIDSVLGIFALKQYAADDFSREKLHRIHHFQNQLASLGFDKTPGIISWPDGQSLCIDRESYWEVSTWKHGEPISAIGLATRQQIQNAVESLAELHSISKRYMETEMISEGLQFRRESLSQVELNFQDQRFAAKLLDPQFLRLVETVQRHSQQRLPTIRKGIKTLAERRWSCHWILRDAWRDHILFQGDRVTGIIDFSASAIDAPILDLTRLLGTMMMPDDGRWSVMVEAYCKLSDYDFSYEVVRLLDEVSTFLSARNWINWLASGKIELDNVRNRSRERTNEIENKLSQFQQMG